MAIVINAIITVILLYYAYKYASGGTMIIKHPFKVGEYYECNNNLSFMIFSVMTAMVFLGPLSLVKYAIWIFFMLLMSRRWVKKWDGVMTIYLIFILWNLYTLTYSHYIFQGWMMIVKFCLPILYFWVGGIIAVKGGALLVGCFLEAYSTNLCNLFISDRWSIC